MLHKIGVIGEKDSVIPFRMLGWAVHYCQTSPEARAALENMAQDNFGVIYLTESLAQGMMDVIEKYDRQLKPIITLIPSHKDTNPIAMRRVEDFVSKAIGKNIL